MAASALLSSQVSLDVAGLTMLNVIQDNTHTVMSTLATLFDGPGKSQVYTGVETHVNRMWGKHLRQRRWKNPSLTLYI